MKMRAAAGFIAGVVVGVVVTAAILRERLSELRAVPPTSMGADAYQLHELTRQIQEALAEQHKMLRDGKTVRPIFIPTNRQP